MNKAKKNFLFLTLTIFFCLVFLSFIRQNILWSFDLSEVQSRLSEKAYEQAELEQNIDKINIIVGDSASKQAIDPSLISDRLFNLSLSGASPALLEEQLKFHKISKVRCSFIQTTYDPSIAYGNARLELETHLERLNLRSLLQHYADSKVTGRYPSENYSLLQYLAFHYLHKYKLVISSDGMFSSPRLLTFFLKDIDKTFDLIDVYKNSYNKRGFVELHSALRQMKKSEFNRYNRYKFWFKSHSQIDSEIKPLYEFLKTISENVYYIEMPLFSNSTFPSDLYKKHKTAHLCPHLGIAPENCITFNSYSNVLFFNNPTHLNKIGAQVFSQKFKEVFAKCFN